MAPFGAQLKKIREQRGITLDQISSSTKIGVRFLSALEDEHFEQLPGGIFNKGFVRSYARTIGVDEDQAIADYLAASGEDQPKKSADAGDDLPLPIVVAAKRESVTHFQWRSLALPLMVIIVMLSLAFWAFHPRQLNVVERAGVPGPKAATNVSSVSTSEHPQSGVTENRELSTKNQLHSPTPSSPISSVGTFVVKIRASDDSWLSITADGKEIMQDTLATEEEKSIEAQKEIVIKAGNVGGVDLWFNGNKLPSQGEYGNVRILTFDANGLRPLNRNRNVPPE